MEFLDPRFWESRRAQNKKKNSETRDWSNTFNCRNWVLYYVKLSRRYITFTNLIKRQLNKEEKWFLVVLRFKKTGMHVKAKGSEFSEEELLVEVKRKR